MKIIIAILAFSLLYAPPPTYNEKWTNPIEHQRLIDYNEADKVLPGYILSMCKDYGIDKGMVLRWSFTESRHDPKAVSKRGAYGRFQITHEYLDDYCRWRGKKFPKHWKEFLYTDIENARIALWTVYIMRKIGFSDREIMQVWLFGAKGVYEDDRFSTCYDSAIFIVSERVKLNYAAYSNFINGVWE